MRAALVAAALVVLAAPAARADTKVTSLRPWAEDNTYLVRVNLDGRTAPRLEPRASIDFLKAGQWVRITCQTTGESAYGSTVWDKVGPFYVPDHYIKTYTDGFIPQAPRCGASGRLHPGRHRSASATSRWATPTRAARAQAAISQRLLDVRTAATGRSTRTRRSWPRATGRRS